MEFGIHMRGTQNVNAGTCNGTTLKRIYTGICEKSVSKLNATLSAKVNTTKEWQR